MNTFANICIVVHSSRVLHSAAHPMDLSALRPSFFMVNFGILKCNLKKLVLAESRILKINYRIHCENLPERRALDEHKAYRWFTPS